MNMRGSRIRKFRNYLLISQQQLSNLTKIPKYRLGRIEREEVEMTINELLSISEHLQITPKDIVVEI